MTRLIDADKLLAALRKSHEYHAETSRDQTLLDRDIRLVEEQPTVEARPKGEWVYRQHGKYVDMCCSVCGQIRYRNIAYNYTVEEVKKSLDGDFYDNFCLYCGAEMGGTKDDK